MMRWLWTLADPLLLRLRERFAHLDAHHPSSRRDRELRGLAHVAESANLFATTRFDLFAPEQLTIGAHARVHGAIRVATPEARVVIGEHSYVGPGTMVLCEQSVVIGRYVLIANGVDIMDNDAHVQDWRERRAEADAISRGEAWPREKVPKAPVVVEDDVWIGAKSTILKGVRVGRGAVVAAGSVVVRDVAPFTLVAGVPAKPLRELPR